MLSKVWWVSLAVGLLWWVLIFDLCDHFKEGRRERLSVKLNLQLNLGGVFKVSWTGHQNQEQHLRQDTKLPSVFGLAMHHWQKKTKGTLKWYLHLTSCLKTQKSWVMQKGNQKLLIDNYFSALFITNRMIVAGIRRELRQLKGTEHVSHKTVSDSFSVLWEACKRWGVCKGRWEGGKGGWLSTPSSPVLVILPHL